MPRRAKQDSNKGEKGDLPKCSNCDRSFTRHDNLVRHKKICKKRAGEPANEGESSAKKRRCDTCEIEVENLHAHFRTNAHRTNICAAQDYDEYVKIIDTAYKSRIATYRVHSRELHLTPKDFMSAVRKQVTRLIADKQAEVLSAVKVNLELFAKYTKWMKADLNVKEQEVGETKSFNTKNKVFYMGEDHTEMYDSFSETICARADEFEEKDSGWALRNIEYLEVNINKYAPLKGSSYIRLPLWIRKKHAVVNVANKDDACFAWAIVSALYPKKKNRNRLKSYPHYSEVLNLQNISFPVTVRDIRRFEMLNDVSVNVFEIKNETIAGPIYHTKQKREKHVNLLLIEKGHKSHYCWIRNLSKLISSQNSKHEHRIHVCDSCLLTFQYKSILQDHEIRGCSHVMTRLPELGKNTLKFKNYKNRLQVPVIVYADFEALLVPINSGSASESSPLKTEDIQLHVPYSFGYYIKCYYDDSLSKFVTRRGRDCAKDFLPSLEKELAPFAKRMTLKKPMNKLTAKQMHQFNTTRNCHICKEKLGQDRVHDHCHLTGKFRGAAHKNCNLNFKKGRVIPIVLHNLSKYDSHFIVQTLQDRNISILANSKENFISFTSKKHGNLNVDLRFIDSYRFLASGLDKLASNLQADRFTITRKHFPDTHTSLVCRKGVFPYDYLDCVERLEETSLPPQNCFDNKLNKSKISAEDYEHAKNVWAAFNIKSLGEYSDLYLKIDVLLLADVFGNFRKVCLDTYELDPAHYYSAPGLSWDAMLYLTKVKLELFTDYDMYKFVAEGIRGGLSQCNGKLAMANNEFVKGHDPKKPTNFIVYLDANNHYGWAMSQCMPLKDFRWLSQDEVDNFKVKTVPSNAATGYILEVDLEYPSHLHDLHNDFCFCPERRTPETRSAKTPKLLSCLHNKTNYAIHYMNLKQALEAGLVLKKTHRILAFSQSPWAKDYIDLNTGNRMAAKNEFEKEFFKLMNNSVFGKTMENVDKRVDVQLTHQREKVLKKNGAQALISRPNFHSILKINEDLAVIQLNKTKVEYNKPIYVGFAVLELSKTLMYEFHYGYMLPKYKSDIKLLYTDTDSFIYDIRTDNFYEDIRSDLNERFDTSGYPADNVYKLPLVNKKVVGKFKDEYSGVPIKEFIGIRSKCYYLGLESGEEIKKIKGVNASVVRNEVRRDDFYSCINDEPTDDKITTRSNRKRTHTSVVVKTDSKQYNQYRKMNVIRSKAHQLYTQTVEKLTLNNNDDKRFAKPDSQHETLAWGHRSIRDKYNYVYEHRDNPL